MEDKDIIINELREQLNQVQGTLSTIEDDCNEFAKDIIRRLCKRAIKRMNKQIQSTGWNLSDDYPDSFNFFDILSIEYQSMCFDEIYPHLENYILDSLNYELDDLPEIDKFVLINCSHLEYGYDGLNCLYNGAFECFVDLLNEHYSTVKISRYLCNRGF